MVLRKAVRKEARDLVTAAGDYAIFALKEGVEGSGIMFVCPHNGCGDKTHLPLKPSIENVWSWNEGAQTLSPSIQRLDPERCNHHFSLINGEWVP